MKNQNLLILLLIGIIAVLIVVLCIMAVPTTEKEDCKLELSNVDTLSDGDTVTIKLTSQNGAALSNETIKVTLNANNKTIKSYNLTTDSDGVAKLEISGVDAEKYKLICKFDGNEFYNANKTSKSITVEEGTVETISQDTSSSSSVDPIEANRPRNDISYKGGTPYHESETTASGWNPQEHETYRENNPDGTHTIHYDDGYFRIVDENGYVITYGYGS